MYGRIGFVNWKKETLKLMSLMWFLLLGSPSLALYNSELCLFLHISLTSQTSRTNFLWLCRGQKSLNAEKNISSWSETHSKSNEVKDLPRIPKWNLQQLWIQLINMTVIKLFETKMISQVLFVESPCMQT